MINNEFMVSQELGEYIEECREIGNSSQEIRVTLIEKGWDADVIDEALKVHDISTSRDEKEGSEPQLKDLGSKNKIISFFDEILVGSKRFRVLLVALVLAIIAGIYPISLIITFGLPFINNLQERIEEVVSEVFPEELEITIKDGKASSNVTEPYHLTVSLGTLQNIFKTKEEVGQPQSKIRILTINTRGKVEDFERYQTIAMLTGSNLVYYSDEGVQLQSLRSAPDMVVNKHVILSKINELNSEKKITRILKTALYLSPLLIVLGLFIKFLAEFLVGAVFIWFIGKIYQLKIPFSQLFRFSAALYALPLLVLIFANLIPGYELFYGWFNTGLNILVIAIAYIFLDRYKNKIA